MYGMIHQAAEIMVIDKLGEARWREICDVAGLQSDFFIGFEYYPDSKTLDLIGTIADRMDMSTEDVLFEFGRYWISYAGSSAYGRALSMAGRDLIGFFQQLDRLHAAVKTNLPKADMPSFIVRNVSIGGFDLHYKSSREGLQPFVHGLIDAIATSFGENVRIIGETKPCAAVFHVQRLERPTQ